MKTKSLFKSVVSLVVTASVVLSLGVASFARAGGIPCTEFVVGDTISAGTVIEDVQMNSYILIYASMEALYNEDAVQVIRSYDTWTSDADYTVAHVNQAGGYYYDLYLIPAETSSSSSEISLTPEQRRLLSVQSFVETLYDRILGRTYDVTGRDYWVDQLMNHGATGSDVVRGFIASSEFATARGSTSSLVLELYSDLFNRVPSAAELANWTSALEKGASKDEILNSFLSSPEWADVCAFYGVNV